MYCSRDPRVVQKGFVDGEQQGLTLFVVVFFVSRIHAADSGMKVGSERRSGIGRTLFPIEGSVGLGRGAYQ